MKTIEQQIEYFNEHPASCLSQFTTRPIYLEGINFNGHGSSGIYPNGLAENPNIIFSINCSCECNQQLITAESTSGEIIYYEDLIIAERYYLKCVTCSRNTLLFNRFLNGYDAEATKLEGFADDEYQISEKIISEDEQSDTFVECKCIACGNSRLEVFTRFEYPNDLFEDAIFSNSEHNFFSWFTIVVKCSGCSALNILADFECA